MEEKTFYELTPSQEVVMLQCKYTLFKRVVNITFSATSEEKLDWKTMKIAFFKTIERNDCLRLRFKIIDKKMMQYFEKDVAEWDIPYVEFKSEQEQNRFIAKETSKPIKFKKGEVVKVFFCKSFDGKDMVLFKVCHLILDMYGINVILKDLFAVYNALKNNEELPAQPKQYEELVKKDIVVKNNKEFMEANREFFSKYLLEREHPYYAGLHGLTTDLAKKEFDSHSMKMFFINCDTKGSMIPFGKELSNAIVKFCTEKKISPANLIFFACSVCQSKMNNNVENMLQLELCNCRGTALEKNAAGTKVQSVGCYVSISQDKTINESLKEFNTNQFNFYKHLGLSDIEFEKLVHQTYHTPFLRTYYALTFSFIPMKRPQGVNFQIYSNGKCALPAYVAAMYDIDTNEIDMVYDCQTKLMNEKHVEKYHNNLMLILKQIIENPEQKIENIKVILN